MYVSPDGWVRKNPRPPLLCGVLLAISFFEQVLFVAGVIMAVAQLFIFPSVIKYIGAVKWMRIGCLLGISAFLAVPNVTFFSWNSSTLFAMSVAGVTVVNCCLAAVSAMKLNAVFHQ